MLNKLLSILLLIALLFTIVPNALAARMSNTFSLYNTAIETHTKENQVVYSMWKEFSNGNVGDIVMSPGEHITTPAFHAISTDVLSYCGIEVFSSDTSIATGEPAYVGASPVGGIANSFLGMTISAHKPGTCIITMTYDTFVTKAGLSDQRGNTGYAKAFNVTVTDGSLKISLATNQNEILWDYDIAYKSSKDFYQSAAEVTAKDTGEKLITIGATTIASATTAAGVAILAIGLGITAGPALIVAGGLLTLAVGSATQVSMNEYFDNNPDVSAMLSGNEDTISSTLNTTSQYIEKNILPDLIPANSQLYKDLTSATKAGYDVSQIARSVTPLQDSLDASLEAVSQMYEIDNATLARNYPVPIYSPRPVILTINLTNNSPKTITNVSTNITSTDLSLTSDNGPFFDSRIESTSSIGPWETVPLKIRIYPKKNYAHNGASGTTELLYNGTVSVHCTYTDGQLQETRKCSNAIEIPVYSCLSTEDAILISKTSQFYPELRMVFAMCPIEMEVIDKNGNTVAFLTTDGDDVMVGDLFCCISGDAKYIALPQDQVNDYSLRITAVDDGNMTILGMDTGHTTNLASYDVSIQKGQTFDVSLNENLPATLYSLSIEGEKTNIEPTAVLNEQVILEALDATDVSDYAKADVAQALSRGLVPLQAAGAYQEELTLEEFCYLLVNFYEKRLGLLPGTLISDGKEQGFIPQGANEAIAAAAWLDFLDVDYFEKSFAENAAELHITVEDALLPIVRLMDYIGGDMSNGVMGKSDVLTREMVIYALNNMWNNTDRNEYIETNGTRIFDTLIAEMERAAIEEFNYIPYYRKNETKKTLIRDFAIYAPSEAIYTFDSEDPESALSSLSGYISLSSVIAESFLTKYIDGANPIDFKTLNSNKQLTLKLSTLGWTAFIDDYSTLYQFIPIYYETQDGSIYQNTVYLAMLKVTPKEDTAEMINLNLKSQGPISMWLAFAADQNTVGEYLAQTFADLQEISRISGYHSLGLNDEGEAVRLLQEKLIEEGFLKGEAHGIYDDATKTAVLALQQTYGIKATGTADEATQMVLNGNISASEAAYMKWLMPHLARLRGEQEPTISVQIIKDCNIRKEPNVSSARVGGAVKDDLLTLIDTDTTGWYHIQMPDGTEGYISSTVGQILE